MWIISDSLIVFSPLPISSHHSLTHPLSISPKVVADMVSLCSRVALKAWLIALYPSHAIWARDRGFRGAGCAIAHPENPEGVQTPIFAHSQFVVGAHAALALECPKPILEGPSASLMIPHRCLKA